MQSVVRKTCHVLVWKHSEMRNDVIRYGALPNTTCFKRKVNSCVDSMIIGSLSKRRFCQHCRGGTGLKTVFVSVCGNLQHIWQNIRFLLPYTNAMMQNTAKINYTNFWVTSVLTKTSLALNSLLKSTCVRLSFGCCRFMRYTYFVSKLTYFEMPQKLSGAKQDLSCGSGFSTDNLFSADSNVVSKWLRLLA
jgi:hypothetical protein